MTSLRNSPAVEERAPRDVYLDAARDCILDVGWRRTTLTDVARRAGVSRMTIYRTWADMAALLGDLMTREWSELVEWPSTTRQPVQGPLSVLRADVVQLVQRLRANDLFMRIVELDPELILPYLFSRRGRAQEAVLARIAATIRQGQRVGAFRPGDAGILARTILLAAQGFVLSAQTMVDDDVSLPQLDTELGHLVERVLAP